MCFTTFAELETQIDASDIVAIKIAILHYSEVD